MSAIRPSLVEIRKVVEHLSSMLEQARATLEMLRRIKPKADFSNVQGGASSTAPTVGRPTVPPYSGLPPWVYDSLLRNQGGS